MTLKPHLASQPLGKVLRVTGPSRQEHFGSEIVELLNELIVRLLAEDLDLPKPILGPNVLQRPDIQAHISV